MFQKFQKKELYFIVAAVVIMLVMGLVVDISNKSNNVKVVASNETQGVVSANQSIKYNGEDGKTALELLQKNNLARVDQSSAGSFVTSINGLDNTSTEFWMFYVNGKLSSTGSDQYKTKSSDLIEWRYEKANF